MRDPNRIYKTMARVQHLWTLMPDARLGQVLSYIKDLIPVRDGHRLTSTNYLMIEDHVFLQFIEEAIAKLEEQDYNVQTSEREYIDESTKRKTANCSSSG